MPVTLDDIYQALLVFVYLFSFVSGFFVGNKML